MGKTRDTGFLGNCVFTDTSNNVGIGAAANASYKLQVTGATNLTGALSGTSATFSSTIASNRNDSGNISLTLSNAFINQGNLINFVHNSGGSTTNGYIGHGGDSTGNLVFINNGITALSFARSTGAATFSSSVTAGGVINANSSGQLKLESNNETTNIAYANFINTSGFLRWGVESSTGAGLFSGTSAYSSVIGSVTNTNFHIATNGAARLTVTNGGNVGIGTSSPVESLQVIGNIRASNRYYINDGTNTLEIGANYIQAYLNSGASSTNLAFYTGTAERMRITSGGNVQINNNLAIGRAEEGGVRLSIQGATAGSDGYSIITRNSSLADLLVVRNDGGISMIRVATSFTTGGAANMYIDSGNGYLYRSTSSLKYKQNVENYTKGLAEVMQLRPVSYQGKSEVDEGKTYAGLIAEEVHELGLTEFVVYAEDGTPDALAYSNMVALLVKAIQEQTQIIKDLEARIVSLESK
jgi:hypothetical protein